MQTCIWPSWCHSLSVASAKSRLVLPFWYHLTWAVPRKRAVKYACVCEKQNRRERRWLIIMSFIQSSAVILTSNPVPQFGVLFAAVFWTACWKRYKQCYRTQSVMEYPMPENQQDGKPLLCCRGDHWQSCRHRTEGSRHLCWSRCDSECVAVSAARFASCFLCAARAQASQFTNTWHVIAIQWLFYGHYTTKHALQSNTRGFCFVGVKFCWYQLAHLD